MGKASAHNTWKNEMRKNKNLHGPKYWQGTEGGRRYGYLRIPCDGTREQIEHWVLQLGGLHLEYCDWVKKGGLAKEPYGANTKKGQRFRERNNLVWWMYQEGSAKLNEKKCTKPDLERKINGALAKRHWGELKFKQIQQIFREEQIRKEKRYAKIKKMSRNSAAFSHLSDEEFDSCMKSDLKNL